MATPRASRSLLQAGARGVFGRALPARLPAEDASTVDALLRGDGPAIQIIDAAESHEHGQPP